MAARRIPPVGDFDENSILAALRHEGLRPHRWSNGPGDVFAAHRRSYEKVLYCPGGSIAFHLTESSEPIELGAGDRLEIDAGSEHAAVAGDDGVTYMEAGRTPVRR